MSEKLSTLWNSFFSFYNLNEEQKQKFYKYFDLLNKWNELHNITRITDPESIILDHFWDSLSISKKMDLNKIESLADVGSGGGFPVIPIKIMFPHLKIYPIEVVQKKVAFLEAVSQELEFENVFIFDVDWRTFLRTTDFKIDLFTARASLQIDELLRVFKPGCKYKDAKLVYWASKNWDPTEFQKKHIFDEYEYSVGDKLRRLIFFKD